MGTTGTNFGDDALADEQGLAPTPAMPNLPGPTPATPTLAKPPVGPGRHLLTGLVGVLIDGLQAGMQAPMSAQGPSQAAAMGAQMPVQRQQQKITLQSQKAQMESMVAQSHIQRLQTFLLLSRANDELIAGVSHANWQYITDAVNEGRAKQVGGDGDFESASTKRKELVQQNRDTALHIDLYPTAHDKNGMPTQWGVFESYPKDKVQEAKTYTFPGNQDRGGKIPDKTVAIKPGMDTWEAKSLFDLGQRDQAALVTHDDDRMKAEEVQKQKSQTALDVAGIKAKAAAAKAAVPKPEKPQDMVIGTVSGKQVAGTMDDLKAIGATSMTKAGAAESEKIQNARSMMTVFDSNDPDDPGLVQLAAKLDQQGKLGPAATRFQNWLNAGNTVANFDAGDPDVQRLFTKLGLSTTGLMQVHVGARGSAQLLEHFEKLANAKQMSSTAFRAALDTENSYIRMKAMLPRADGGAGRAAAGAGRAPTPPAVGEVRNGYEYKGGNPADPNSWVKPKKAKQ